MLVMSLPGTAGHGVRNDNVVDVIGGGGGGRALPVTLVRGDGEGCGRVGEPRGVRVRVRLEKWLLAWNCVCVCVCMYVQVSNLGETYM